VKQEFSMPHAEYAVSVPKRIFIIEDNDADALIIEEALPISSFAVTRFEDGREAIEQLQKLDSLLPDAILLDLNLPRSEGLDILRQIRYSPKLSQIPVGILTGSEISNDELRASNLGARRYIHKPKSYDAFVSGVREAVERMLEPG
jgi:two-component system, chemotaxis family, response regulator Rcp1